MSNRSASLVMQTSILKALPGKLDIKRHSPSILYINAKRVILYTYAISTTLSCAGIYYSTVQSMQFIFSCKFYYVPHYLATR